MDLLTDDALERSAVVANCRMNRERDLRGSNGYDRELGIDPLGYLGAKAAGGRQGLAWLDLCCGTGKAQVQAAGLVEAESGDLEIVGVDLAGLFLPSSAERTGLRLVEASLREWRAEREFDLITCVHGLHYVGDKLGLIARAAMWLSDDGLLVANLDPHNLRLEDGGDFVRRIAVEMRRQGLERDKRKGRVVCRGRREVRFSYGYLGADDQAGPNITGQPAVSSYYRRLEIGHA